MKGEEKLNQIKKMETKTKNKGRPVVVLFLLFIYLILIFQFSKEANVSIIDFLEKQPIYLFALIITLFFWFFFTIKENTKEDLKKFVRDNLLKYFSKFIAFTITAFLALVIFFQPGEETLFRFVIEIVLFLSAFAVFLLASWFEESKSPPLTKKNVKDIGVLLFKVGSVIIVPSLIIGLGYFLISYLNFGTSLIIGFIQATLIIAAASPKIKKKVSKIILTLIILILEIAMLWTMIGLPNLNLDYKMFMISSAIGIVLAILGLVLSSWLNEKDWFKKATKEAYGD